MQLSKVTKADHRAPGRPIRFVLAVVLFGVGLVLFVASFDSAVTELRPFGLALLVVGVVAAVPNLRAFRLALAPDAVAVAIAEAESPPTPKSRGGAVARTVHCAHCGATVSLKLAEPRGATCSYCKQHFALPNDVATSLEAAALHVGRQSAAERQLSQIVAALPGKERAWRRRVAVWSGAFSLLAVIAAGYGWLARYSDSFYLSYILFALIAAPIAALSSWALVRFVARVTQAIAGRWAAVSISGVPELVCRVCGAPLPERAEAVLRCEFCASDNLASSAVLTRVAGRARAAETAFVNVSARQHHADELASLSLVAFPLLVLTLWFAAAAFAAMPGRSKARYVEIAPDPGARFALVRVKIRKDARICLAAVRTRGSATELVFDSEREVPLPGREVIAGEELSATAVSGLLLANGRRIVRVFRRLGDLHQHLAETDSVFRSAIYLPATDGAGELTCIRRPAVDNGPRISLEERYGDFTADAE
jgi:hypothetical protein